MLIDNRKLLEDSFLRSVFKRIVGTIAENPIEINFALISLAKLSDAEEQAVREFCKENRWDEFGDVKDPKDPAFLEAEKKRQAEFNSMVIYQFVNCGLKVTNDNFDKIGKWLRQNGFNFLRPSAEQLNSAINALRTELDWKKEEEEPPAPPPAPPVEPPKPPRILSNGEQELPLDSTPAEMRRASKEQLGDLAKRQQSQKKYGGNKS